MAHAGSMADEPLPDCPSGYPRLLKAAAPGRPRTPSSTVGGKSADRRRRVTVRDP